MGTLFRRHPLGPKLAFKIGAGVALIATCAWAGLHFGHLVPAMEQWVAGHGVLGMVVFIGIVVVCTSLYVPDTVFAVIAGVLFGLGWGTVVIAIASLTTAVVDFAITRYFLRDRGRRWLDAKPRLRAVEQAVSREGLRFLFLLRLTPMHPVTVSYVLGVTSTRFGVFLAANFGLIPALFVEVYFGYMAKHAARLTGRVSEHSTPQIMVNVFGLIACVAVLVYVTRIARRALAAQGAVGN